METARLRWIDARFLGGIALPLLSLFNVTLRPTHAAVGAFAIWLTIALLEAAWPRTRHSPPAAGPRPALLWLLRAYVPLQLVLLAAALQSASRVEWSTVFGLAFAVGFVTGAQGITYAHELGHGRRRADRALGWVLMTAVNYPQFMVEHYRGHHVRAATHDDPASARLGESLWRFLPRTLAGTLVQAWRLEAARLRVHKRTWVSSPMVWSTVFNVAFIALLAAWSTKAVVFWLAQSAFAVWLLETVNYIEHYGLQRRRHADGRFEPFGVQHAWNADHAISNSLLANLQRHSDHHVNAWKPYPELADLPEAPRLPTGYAGCLLLAAIPPLWFGFMHPRMSTASSAG